VAHELKRVPEGEGGNSRFRLDAAVLDPGDE
jgi:hypothetical protein